MKPLSVLSLALLVLLAGRLNIVTQPLKCAIALCEQTRQERVGFGPTFGQTVDRHLVVGHNSCFYQRANHNMTNNPRLLPCGLCYSPGLAVCSDDWQAVYDAIKQEVVFTERNRAKYRHANKLRIESQNHIP